MTVPLIILVEPQMGENIGMVARAMANMGLERLRLVAPRDGWPNEKAIAASSGAAHILEAAEFFETLDQAIADCHFVVATSARAHAQAKPIAGPAQISEQIRKRQASGQQAAVLFGRERYGLKGEEVSLSHALLTFPVNPAFSSLNLAQAVLLFGYAWMLSGGEEGELIPHVTDLRSLPATPADMAAFFDRLIKTLDEKNYFLPPQRRETMTTNLRNIFNRMEMTAQDIRTLHGVIDILESKV